MAYNKNKNSNSEKKNTGNKNREFKKRERLHSEDMSFTVTSNGVSGTREYDPDSLFNLLNSLEEAGTFKNISVPVYMYRDDITGKAMKGTTQVGVIKSYDGNLNCNIFGMYVDIVKKLKNPTVYAKCMVADNEVQSIMALEICEFNRYFDSIEGCHSEMYACESCDHSCEQPCKCTASEA